MKFHTAKKNGVLLWRRSFPCEVIRHLEDPSFRQHFRMTKVVFERQVVAVGNCRHQLGILERVRTPVAEATLMGLWVLFNPDTFRSEGLNFDVSQSVIHCHYEVLLKVLCKLGPMYIKWPSAIERERTALFYERTFGFPGIVGSIDGTLIRITAPNEQKQRYVDRHSNYSVNVQIVSDHRRLIRDLYGGMPGSVNDACLFRQSPLAKNLYSRPDMMDADQHLIGDGAYVNTSRDGIEYQDAPPRIDVMQAMAALEEEGNNRRRFIRLLFEDNDVEDVNN